MNSRDFAGYTVCRVAQNFLDAHDDVLGPVNEAGVRKQFDRTLDDIDAWREGQATRGQMMRSATASLAAAKRHLRLHHLEPIKAMARLLESTYPPLRTLRLPKARANTTRLLDAAVSFAAAASQYEAHFIDLGLPVDFIDDLRSAAGVVLALEGTREGAKISRIGMTHGVDTMCELAALQLKAIGQLVRTHVANHPKIASDWREVARLPQHRQLALTAGTPTPQLGAGAAPLQLAAGPEIHAEEADQTPPVSAAAP